MVVGWPVGGGVIVRYGDVGGSGKGMKVMP